MSVKKIAALTGTSASTVSRVLNDPTYHSKNPELVQKIYETARALNYVPNEAARNLKKGINKAAEKNPYIQVLIIRPEKNISWPFYAEMLKIVESELHKNSCILSNVWNEPVLSNSKKIKKIDVNKMIRDMYSETEGKSDGLIVLGHCDRTVMETIKTVFRNVVMINRSRPQGVVDEVICDGTKVASLAVEQLIRLGHKSIGYVGIVKNEARYEGFIQCMKNNNLEVDYDYVFETDPSETAGFEVGRKLFEEDPTITAVYCSNDIIAVGLLKAMLKRRNKHLSLSVISSDDIDQAKYIRPLLSTIAVPKEEMGRYGVMLLLNRIRGVHESTVTVEFEGKCIKRDSCTDVAESFCEYYI